MTLLKRRESTIARSDPAELAQFRQWFAKFDSDALDTQIEADAAAGKLDALAAEALAEHHAGTAKDI